jgi:ribosomal protein L5
VSVSWRRGNQFGTENTLRADPATGSMFTMYHASLPRLREYELLTEPHA